VGEQADGTENKEFKREGVVEVIREVNCTKKETWIKMCPKE